MCVLECSVGAAAFYISVCIGHGGAWGGAARQFGSRELRFVVRYIVLSAVVVFVLCMYICDC